MVFVVPSCLRNLKEIFNRTHVSLTPKPAHLIARSQLPLESVGKVPFNF